MMWEPGSVFSIFCNLLPDIELRHNPHRKQKKTANRSTFFIDRMSAGALKLALVEILFAAWLGPRKHPQQ
jgi:hypothetical protein